MTRSFRKQRVIGALCGVAFSLCAGESAMPLVDRSLITTIAEIRELSKEGALKGTPVRIRGIVTYRTTEPLKMFVVDDGVAGVSCNVSLAQERALFGMSGEETGRLRAGDQVEVEGVSDPGNYSPVIVPRAFRVLGHGSLPKPKKTDIFELFSGTLDAQRVAVEGVVRVAKRLEGGRGISLHVGTLFQRFQVVMLDVPYENPERLVDARVRVSGCMLPIFNARWELIGVSVQTNLREDLRVLQPAKDDPFDLPTVSLSDVRPFSMGGVNLHRHKVCGMVTVCRPGDFLYLQEGDRTLRVSVDGREAWKPGDLVEAVGFVNFNSAITRLESALVRKVGAGRVPEPIVTSIENLLTSGGDPSQKPDVTEWNGALVTVEGLLVGIEHSGKLCWMTLGDEGRFITASLPSNAGAEFLRCLSPGAFLRATGVANVNYRVSSPSGDWVEAASVNLHMREPSDIQIIHRAPWWTPQRVNWTVGLLAALILAGVLWIFALRRVVTRQANRLELSLRAHRDAELEFEATKRERLRLAHDLHDGFQQLLAGSMFRLKAALNYLPDDPGAARTQLEHARESLRHTQGGLRSALWGLTEESEGPPDFVGLLRHAVRRMEHWQGIVQVRCEGVERPMSRHMMGSLLMVVQEAVGNAIRHGRASEVVIEVALAGEGMTLVICDNGCGFDPAASVEHKSGIGHLGLGGMRERLRWLGGTLTVTSRPGEGARVVAHVAWRCAHEAQVVEGAGGVEAPQPES